MKQEKTAMPYAWYWHGKPLRTGLAQGERIRPVCTGSHILQTSDQSAPDRLCCSLNMPDKPCCPCGHGHGHGHGNNTESYHWIPEPPQQKPNHCSPEAQAQPRHCGPEGHQGQIPGCFDPPRTPASTFTCKDCPCDIPCPEPCSLDRCCTAEAIAPQHPFHQGDPCCQSPQDIPYPATRCKFCPPHPKVEMHCSDSPGPRSQHHQAASAPMKCQQSFTRFESCDRFDCCDDTFFSKCEYSTEESLETGHGHDADFETRSYHRRRPWMNHQLYRRY